jgi:hypothetical protein
LHPQQKSTLNTHRSFPNVPPPVHIPLLLAVLFTSTTAAAYVDTAKQQAAPPSTSPPTLQGTTQKILNFFGLNVIYLKAEGGNMIPELNFGQHQITK